MNLRGVTPCHLSYRCRPTSSMTTSLECQKKCHLSTRNIYIYIYIYNKKQRKSTNRNAPLGLVHRQSICLLGGISLSTRAGFCDILESDSETFQCAVRSLTMLYPGSWRYDFILDRSKILVINQLNAQILVL